MHVRRKNNVTFAGREAGPTLLLVNGFGADQALWRMTAKQLQDDFRLVSFDHVGSGRSDPSAWSAERYSSLQAYADDILDIVDELDLRDVTLVGHSVAAIIGVLALAKDPGRFAKLIMLTPSPCYLDSDGYTGGGYTRADIDELLESMEANYLGWSRAMAPKVFGAPEQPEVEAELTESWQNDPVTAQVFARATFLSDNRADLARVSLPTLVIACAHDSLVPPEAAAYTHRHIRGSKLVTIDATGHCPHLSAPEATAAAISAFAAGP